MQLCAAAGCHDQCRDRRGCGESTPTSGFVASLARRREPRLLWFHALVTRRYHLRFHKCSSHPVFSHGARSRDSRSEWKEWGWSLQAISANVTAVMLIPPIQHGMLQRGLCWRMTHLVRLDG